MTGSTDQPRIHITGASGTGVSTLGEALAQALNVAHVDIDDVYWMPTDPRFTTKRAVPERLEILARAQGSGGWVVAGSLCGWGDAAIAGADLIVFLSAPTAQRVARLRRRERAWFGDRIAPGGDMERIHREFISWAMQYDDPHFTGRSRMMHETWLIEQTAPVLRLDGTTPVAELTAQVCRALGSGVHRGRPAPPRRGRGRRRCRSLRWRTRVKPAMPQADRADRKGQAS